MVTTKHKSRPETHFEKGSWETHIIDNHQTKMADRNTRKRNRDTTKDKMAVLYSFINNHLHL